MTLADPPWYGEEDPAQHGGGGSPPALCKRPTPSTTLLCVARPLPGPARII
jgi:hypothetical protein